MKYIFPIILCLLTVLIEGSITTLPLVLVFLLLYAVLSRSQLVFVYAFVSGLLLDSMQMRDTGSTELFFLCILFLVFLYQRKFEIATVPFVCGSLCMSSLGYTLLFLHHDIWQQTAVATILGVCLFFVLKIPSLRTK